MSKPTTYRSPKLTRLGSHLFVGCDGPAFICIGLLEEILEEFPEAAEYWIEASTKQWRDDSGFSIWVHDRQGFWEWGFTEKQQFDFLHDAVDKALTTSGISKKRPVQIYVRLTYRE